MSFNGLGMHLGNLARISDAETRSISAENVTGGMAQDGTSALGWRSTSERGRRYLLLQDGIASTAFRCQLEPHAPFPTLSDVNVPKVI